MSEYVVYFDLDDSSENKIHRTSCQHYRRHLERKRLGISTTTTEWSKEFPTRAVTEERTKVTRRCPDCEA